ncbi:unnamed protein product, partial [Prorocentrum cordatum]
EFQATRDLLQRQIQEAKRTITLSKPLSSQLVSRRSAVERADKLRLDSKKALAKELKALAANAPKSLEASTQSLSRVIADMRSSPVVPQTTMQEAEKHIMAVIIAHTCMTSHF